MNLLKTIVASSMLVGGVFVANATSSIPHLEGNLTRADKYLTSITFTNADNSKTINVGQTSKGAFYLDCTDQVITAQPGDIIKLSSMNFYATWTSLYGYLYVDYNQDNTLNTTLNADGTVAGGEMVSYTNNRNDGKSPSSSNTNSLGGSAYELHDNGSLPEFTLPENLAAGDYVARFKMEGGYLDPFGQSSSLSVAGAIVDFTIRIEAAAERDVTVISADETMGTVSIEGETETTVTKSGAVTVLATALAGYKFDYWTVEGGDETHYTANPYTYSGNDAVTLVANFSEKSYPEMQRTYDQLTSQNRYLAKVTANVGTYTPQVVFEATAESELPYTKYTTLNTYTSDGALIDKTATPIEIGNEVTSFDVNFISWLYSMQNEGYTCQMDWTQQAVFIDWNNDKEFAGTDEIYEKSSDGLGADNGDKDATAKLFKSETGYTRTINIPDGVEAGTYRMRVVYHEPLYNETAKKEHWQDTFFTANNGVGKIRNGIAYDFALKLTDKTTGVETVNGVETATVVAGANTINVIGEAKTIDVYTTGGALVSHNEANVNCAAGLYIVKVDGNVTKVIVK